jgi:signal transduction histidine kinase
MVKILVIEDEDVLRTNIADILEVNGFEVTQAENGEVGIEMARRDRPDLIICDVMMPEVDGHEVLATLRQDPDMALMSFIFLTAKATIGDVRHGMNLGADDYLTKPFTQSQLLDAIAARLSKHQAVQKLRREIEKLAQSNDLKEQFLGAASEELRGPLTNISMAVEMLRKAPSIEKVQRYVDMLRSECDRELRLINNLFDLQQLQTGARPLRLETIDLQKRLPTMVEPYRQQAQAKCQLLQLTLPPYVSSVVTDPSDLEQLLGELLDNACKFTPSRGKIVLEVSRSPLLVDGTSRMSTTFMVSNQAELSPEQLSKLLQAVAIAPDPLSLNSAQASTESNLAANLQSAAMVSGAIESLETRAPDCNVAESGVAESDITKRHSAKPQAGSVRSVAPAPRLPNTNGLGLTIVQKLTARLNGSVQLSSDGGWTFFVVQLPDQSINSANSAS